MAVSIHAPVKGRRRKSMRRYADLGFNPRPREGATSAMLRGGILTAVSIHAPVKGRPSEANQISGTYMVSIHAPVKGRRTALFLSSAQSQFQSTPP